MSLRADLRLIAMDMDSTLVTIESIDKAQRRIALGPAGEGSREDGPTSYTAPAATMGTFGDLLKARLEQGKKR